MIFLMQMIENFRFLIRFLDIMMSRPL